MTEAVLADAQFGTATVLKPFPNFEDAYQGVRGNIPIAIPGILDPDAGKPGFDPKLLRAHPIAYGSKVSLWIPTIRDFLGASFSIVGYQYKVVFRLRNLRDFRANRKAYHFPRQSLGQDAQFVIPAGKKIILFEGAAGVPAPNRGLANMTKTSFETIEIATNLDEAPLFPGATSSFDRASIEQGLGLGSNQNAIFNPVSLDAEGDEIIILVTKENADADPSVVWDFQTNGATLTDKGFSDFYGKGSGSVIRDTGIYIFTGSNP